VTAGTSIYGFLIIRTAGDPLGELARYDNQGLADNMSKIHMFTAISMAAMAIIILFSLPTWSEYEQVPESEYTYELREDRMVFKTDFDTFASDDVVWANIAHKPEKYCVYRVTSYNMFGGWPSDPRLVLGSPPCEDIDKYEF